MRISNRKRETKEPMFSSRRIFYVLFALFISAVLGRFITLQHLESNTKTNYLFSFNNIYAEFIIKNNQTALVASKNISLENHSKAIAPYSLVTFHLGEHNATYQFIPDKKKHTISLFTRPAWYEIIGGDVKTRNGASIVRLSHDDLPALLIRNHDLSQSLYRAKEIEVIALKEGLFYYSATTEKTPIPYYSGSFKRLLRGYVWKQTPAILMEKSGVITDGDRIIHIEMGSKNLSLLADKEHKRYNLVKASTLNISVTDSKTPSSKLKLVESDFHLSQTKLPYHFVNLAHLLIKYQILDAKKSIIYHTLSQGLLQKELLEKIEDFESFKESQRYGEYLTRQAHLSAQTKKELNQQLIRYVMDGDYTRSKKFILLGADVNVKTDDNRSLLSVVLENQHRYLPLPNIFTFKDKRLVIQGNDALFNFKSYLKQTHFPTQVPILDKPRIPQKEILKSESLNEFVDVTHLNGIYVSDPNATVYYGRDPQRFIQKLHKNYRKSPPLFLYDSEIQGKFVAPSTPVKGKYYYKIISDKSRVTVAYNGHIKRYRGAKYPPQALSYRYNSITPFLTLYEVPLNAQGEAILAVDLEDKLLPCNTPFSSARKIESLQYSFDGKHYKNFKIINQGDGYRYQLPERSKTFKNYHLLIRSESSDLIKYLGDNLEYEVSKNPIAFEYTPSLSCLAKHPKKQTLSLYDESNLLTLIPKEYKEKGMRSKRENVEILDQKKDTNHSLQLPLSQELLPIYGDGLRFGLTSRGVSPKELTLDANFSMKVAEIFKEVIQPLKSEQEKLKRQEHNTILEGASIVLADKGKDQLEIVAMFSYPYPTSLNIEKPEQYKREIFKYMLLDEFNNKNSLLKNRALDMRIRPGSTFKMVTSMAGFKADIIPELDRKYRRYIEGRKDLFGSVFRRGSRVGVHLKNFSFSNGKTERTHGATFKNSFKYSYNVYFGYLSLMLNHKLDNGYKKVLYPISSSLEERKKEFSLIKVAQDLGFNAPIPLSQKHSIKAAPSNFPTNFILAKEVADAGIGQFEVAATPLQMAVVANTIRTGSITYPTIVKGETSKTTHENYISLYAQEEIQEAMYQVINTPQGTAKCAFYHENFYQKVQQYNHAHPNKKRGIACSKYRKKFKKLNPNAFNLQGVKVYGKTGTAEKGKGKLYDGWFVAFTKSDQGDIVVATVVRNSGTGGSYSATITKRIIESWYNQRTIDKNK